jgi:hypothetical protein
MKDKHRLTTDLVELLSDEDRTSVESAMSTWWFNIRKNGGMRLTAVGHDILVKKLQLENYTYSIPDPLIFTKKLILKLDRKMQMPYYISATKGIPKKVILFGSREAIMINLYGNLEQFLDNYKP